MPRESQLNEALNELEGKTALLLMQPQMRYSMAANIIASLCHNPVEANCSKMAAIDFTVCPMKV